MTFAVRTHAATSGVTTIYNGTVTISTYSPGFGTYRGYASFISGSSVSPTTVTTGYTVDSIYDYRYPAALDFFSSFSLSGFGTDPGKDYIYSVTVNGVTKLSSISDYNYVSGTAYWSWAVGSISELWGIGTSGTVGAVVVK